jgi:hypothetical protein
VTKSAPVAQITDPRGRLELLERRRLEIDATLWQIPGLTVAGQAFLLQVLVSKETSHETAKLAAAAGILATVATGLALGHQVARERRHNRAVTALADGEGLGFTGTGKRFWGKWHLLCEARAWAMWIAFLLVLVTLALADGYALAENLSRPTS